MNENEFNSRHIRILTLSCALLAPLSHAIDYLECFYRNTETNFGSTHDCRFSDYYLRSQDFGPNRISESTKVNKNKFSLTIKRQILEHVTPEGLFRSI